MRYFFAQELVKYIEQSGKAEGGTEIKRLIRRRL